MQREVDIDELKVQRICIDCIGEPYLSAQVERANEAGTCDYCEAEDSPTLTIEGLASEIASAFERHFQRTDTEPDGLEYLMIKEGLQDWERHGNPVTMVISVAALIEDDAAEDVRRILEHESFDREAAQLGEEGPFDEDAHYEAVEINDYEFRAQWEYFEQGLKTEARFFNKSAEAVLGTVFEDIERAQTENGQSVIRTCGPGTNLTQIYRARVFQSDDTLKKAIMFPDQEVGAPSTSLAAAGRMNARGISVFYGATDEKIAMAEVRPPVGSRVVVCRFDIIRQVRLLDVAALESLMVEGSYFDPEYSRRLERARFLERLSARITMPVMPDDEAVHHIVTQAMADYLVSRTDLELDGLLYRSVQSNAAGHNVVLFHHSARCEVIELPEGTKVSGSLHAYTDEGTEPDYWVWEEVSAPTQEKAKEIIGFPDLALSSLSPLGARSVDDRTATLRVDAASLKVHHVKAVAFETTAHKVRRHRMEKNLNKDF